VSARGRIVIGTLGLDQHEVGAMAVAQLLMRGGFEVIYLGRFNTPAKLAAVAAQEDAEVVGVSVHSWELAAYAPELVSACHGVGAAVAIGGSVLTEADERRLAAQGIDATFGPYAEEQAILGRIDELVARARAGLLTAPETVSSKGPLDGRVVIVSGAGRGLGRAYADRLVREGAGVVVNDLDGALFTDDHTAVIGDISVPDTSQRLVRTALERFGRLDAVVCNAGLLRSGTLVKATAEDLDAVYAVHVRGTFLLLRAAAHHWRAEHKAGRPVQAAAVTTTSSAGLYGFLGEVAYSGAKAAIAAMTVVAAAELERYGVTVNAVAPAARTRLTTWMGEAPDDDALDPYAAAHVAPVVAWLVSDRARDVTGRVLEVGGDVIAVADGWRQAASAALQRGASLDDVGGLVERLLADAPAPREVQRADPSMLGGSNNTQGVNFDVSAVGQR
jgi:methylmalonyl-CoA mutase cobalamin-binding domain/chain